jgi:hypothetical protein
VKANPIRELAKERPSPHSRPCWACSIPQAQQINEAYAAKGPAHVSAPEILWVLREKYGHKSGTLAQLTSHFTRGHHIGQRKKR